MDGKTRFFADTDTIPIDGVVPRAWRDAVVDDGGWVERILYELCVLVALRDALAAARSTCAVPTGWRDPDDDLPGDFDTTREVHYAAIRQPIDPTAFITGLRDRMTTALDAPTSWPRGPPSCACSNGSSTDVELRRGTPSPEQRDRDCWPTTTRHLRVLLDSQLVSVNPAGRERRYRIEHALHSVGYTIS